MKFLGRGPWRIRSPRALRSGRWIRERGSRSLTLLPHFFTMLNLACGVFSIILTVNGQYIAAAWLVGGSLLADGLDGRMARLVSSDGDFGRELDSLADIVAFGAAPAILAHQLALASLGPWGWAITVFFPICGAMRLAKYNLRHNIGNFVGVPITATGTLLAALMQRQVQQGMATDPWLVAVVMIVLAYLMVSKIPYPDFKKMRGLTPRGHIINWIVPVGVSLWLLLSDTSTFLLAPLVTYMLLGPWTYLLRKAGEQKPRVRAVK